MCNSMVVVGAKLSSVISFFINGCIVYCWQGAPGPTGEPGEEGPAGEQVYNKGQTERTPERASV